MARTEAHVAQLAGYESGEDAHLRATAAALERTDSARTLVLVEGISDQIAVEATAARLGCDLAGQQAVIVPIGGAQAVGRFVERFAGRGGPTLLGLCDVAEREYFAEAFDPLGPGNDYFVCDADLEEELIRTVGQPEFEALLDAEGDLRSFRTMQKQAAWRDRPWSEQMHRWIRSHSRRSSRYSKLLIEVADFDRLPRPLTDLVGQL